MISWVTRATLATFGILLSVAPMAAQCSPERWNLPKQFRLDSYVLSLVVEEAAEPAGAMWSLRGRLLKAIHVPELSESFDVYVHGEVDGCPGDLLAEQELRDRYARGDELMVVGYRSERGLETFTGWVSYGSEVRMQPVQNVFDYASALFRLETYELDTERIQPLRSIAMFVEDGAHFREILVAQLRSKRLRRRMMSIHATLHENAPGRGG